MPVELPKVEVAPVVIPEPVLTQTPGRASKPKTSLNLNGLLKSATPAVEEKTVPVEPSADEQVKLESLLEAWADYTEQRKEQAAEYQFLKREIQFNYPFIQITLTNPVEETLLENFRRDFTQFLRDRLKNSQLTIKGVLQASAGKKVIYTSQDKFDHLAAKNPHLKELKDRLGLDWDF